MQEIRNLKNELEYFFETKRMIENTQKAIWSIHIPLQMSEFAFEIKNYKFKLKTVNGQIQLYREINGETYETALTDYIDDPELIECIIERLLYFIQTIANTLGFYNKKYETIRAVCKLITNAIKNTNDDQ